MSIDIDIGVSALDDYDPDDVPQVQTDTPAVDEDEGTQPAERLMPKGFFSRSLDPDQGADESNSVGLGAPVLEIQYGDRRYVLPLNDPRDIGKVPRLKKGGAMMAGGAGDYRSFMMVDGEDPNGAKQPGSIMISASYSKAGAKKSIGLSINVRDQGTEDVSLLGPDGGRVTMTSSSTVVVAPNGKHYTEIGNNGNVLAGDTKAQGSLVVGQQLAAQPVAIGPIVAACFTALAAAVAAAPGAQGAPAAIAPFLALLSSKHLKAT